MSKTKIREHITGIEAADRLASLSKQLREGSVTLGDGTRIQVANDVDLKTEFKDDELELDLKWRPAKHAAVEKAAAT